MQPYEKYILNCALCLDALLQLQDNLFKTRIMGHIALLKKNDQYTSLSKAMIPQAG